uniref:Candidate secreted effector n=1 Tax=Meloidogyne incognita TaxID=6306 RepID=A0A914MNT6_MELIC
MRKSLYRCAKNATTIILIIIIFMVDIQTMYFTRTRVKCITKELFIQICMDMEIIGKMKRN